MGKLSKPSSIMTTDTIGRPETADTAVEIEVEQKRNNSPRIIEEGEKPPDVPERKEENDPYLVVLLPEDPRHPYSWSIARRAGITMIGALLTLNSSFSSAAPSGLVEEQMNEFGFNRLVGALLISLFVAGYCVGPILWGPLSERYGRRLLFIGPFIPYTLFQVACALSKSTSEILVFRFLGGVFASTPLSNAGALMADIWPPAERGIGVGIFSLAPFAGPALGIYNIIVHKDPQFQARFMSVQHVHWTWIYWVMAIFAGVCVIISLLFLPETYVPYLEHKIAKELQKKENEPRYYCSLTAKQLPLSQRIANIIFKPFKMIVQEPVLLAITVYMSFVYGCLYLLFQAFPIIYMKIHGLNRGEQGLTFLALTVGCSIGTVLYILVFNPRYKRFVKEFAPERVPPEKRLEMAMFGGPLLVIGFFWMGWTGGYSEISIWSPIAATVPIGLSLIFLFLPLMSYIVDVYLNSAASALSINSVCRSTFGAAFPLFATQMYEALGIQWASSLIGFVALALAPIPFLFYKFGPKLRQMSRFSPDT